MNHPDPHRSRYAKDTYSAAQQHYPDPTRQTPLRRIFIMAEYINTPTTDVGENVLGADALDSNQSGIDTPVMEGGATETFPNLDSAPFVSAGPIG